MTPSYSPAQLRPEVVDFFSPSNRRRFTVWCSIPPGDGPFPLLLLLHGVGDSGGHGWWLRAAAPDTVAALAAGELSAPPVLLMPSDTGSEVGSGYIDWADGTTLAETFLIAELLPWATANLPLTPQRWVTGLSMGGYGALMLALRHPGVFASATATSGFFTAEALLGCLGLPAKRIWGGAGERDAHDVTKLVETHNAIDLRIAFDCGTDDPRLIDNRAFHAQLGAARIAHGYAEWPGGHDWTYWRAHFADHVRFHAGLPGALTEGPSR